MNETAYASEFNYKIINDPIYGCIGLSKTEVKLLDTRAMQRLRRIRQMGFASYVFPSGEHSRFVHSLGVLCIMGKMCEHLYRKYSERKSGQPCFSLEDVRKVRIAALLHDVGHFPFSHLSESVYSYIDNKANSAKIVDGFEENHNDDSGLLREIGNFKKRKEKDHEHLGAEVIKRDPEIVKILDEVHIKPEEIGQIIIGDTQAKPVYAQLLHSSLDADRLDYLLRDSRQAGVSFGTVELDYILRQMRIEKCTLSSGGNSKEEIELIVFDIRGQHAIEHFLMARFFHYTQVVQHKTSAAFEAITKALEYKMLCLHEGPYQTYDKIIDCIGKEEFYSFTDDCMWDMLATYGSQEDGDVFKLELWKSLSQRKKPTHVFTLTDIIPKVPANKIGSPVNDSVYLLAKWVLQNMINDLGEGLGIETTNIGYVESKVYLESIPSHLRAEDCSINDFPDDVRGAIRIIDKDNRITFLASDNKSLINKMVDYTSNKIDVFIVGDVSKEIVQKLKDTIMERAKMR